MEINKLIDHLKWFQSHKSGDLVSWQKMDYFKDAIVPEIIKYLEEENEKLPVGGPEDVKAPSEESKQA